MNQQFLDMLCCPQTRQKLSLIPEAQLKELNQMVSQQKLKTINGNTVSFTLSGALIREDNKILYAIREQIPILLSEEGIENPF